MRPDMASRPLEVREEIPSSISQRARMRHSPRLGRVQLLEALAADSVKRQQAQGVRPQVVATQILGGR
jgi:hypothetical protein